MPATPIIPPETPTTETPKVGSFNNPITGPIVIILSLIILWALILAWFGNLPGAFVLGAFAAILWVMGEIKHSPDKPKEVGLIQFYENPLILPWAEKWKDGIVVSGRVVLAPFWPINLDTVKVDIGNKKKEFNFPIVSKDNIPMVLKVSAILRANVKDLIDYIQAGNNMDAVFEQIEPLISRESQVQARDMDGEDIQKKREIMSDHLKKGADNFFSTRSFGVEVLNFQAEAQLPQSLLDKLVLIKAEEYERTAEFAHYKTVRDAAIELQAEHRRRDKGTKITLTECIEQIRTMYLLMKNQVSRVEGGGRPVVVTPPPTPPTI